MSTVALNVTRGQRDEPFYVPTFKVEIGPPGKEPTALKRMWDATRVTYKDGLSQLDTFELTINNAMWGSTDVRYAPALYSRPRFETSPMTIVPGSWARLWLGYETAMGKLPMLTGRVTSVTPTFGGDGGSTMTVRVLSSLEALRENVRQFVWEKKKDSEIARMIAERYKPAVTAVIPAGLDAIESAEDKITQANQTDIAFLIERAKKRGYIVCFRESLPPPPEDQGAKQAAREPQKFLYFGPSNLLQQTELVQMGDRLEKIELSWGSSLLDFRPTFNVSSNLWSSVSVSFWDRRTKKKSKPPISCAIDELWTSEPGLNRDLAYLLRPLIEAKVLPEHPLSESPVHTAAEARDLVRNTLRENFLQLVTAEGTTVGHPDLRACSKVEVRDVGLLSGTYFLVSTTHTIDDGGYRTEFTARRQE